MSDPTHQPYPTVPPPGPPGLLRTEAPAYDDAPAFDDDRADRFDDDDRAELEQLRAERERWAAELERARAGAPAAAAEVDDFELPDIQRGDWVRVWHLDPQMGPETVVEAAGQVVRVDELPSGPAVVVAWVTGGVSDPIPLDHRLHQPDPKKPTRVDAPHVELLET